MKHYFFDLLKRTVSVIKELFKVMLPAMLLVRLLDQYGFTEVISDFIGPAMVVVGLPAELSIVIAISILTNLYAGIGAAVIVMDSLSLSIGQVSVLCSMMLFAHAIPVEQIIVKRAGASFLLTSASRIFAAFAYGALCNYVITSFSLLQEPANSLLVLNISNEDSWGGWLFSAFITISLTFFIVLLLLIILDIFQKIGLIDLLIRFLSPIVKKCGMSAELTPLTIIGLLLGLSYGGGLIIIEAKRKQYSKAELFASLLCISLFHSLIEDTLLMIALGASIWVILFWRILFGFCFLIIVIKLYNYFARKVRV